MALIRYNNPNLLRFQKPINFNKKLDINNASQASGVNDASDTSDASGTSGINSASGTSNNISNEEKEQILQEVKTALKEKDEKWGFNNWNLTDEQIENLYNKLIFDSSIQSFEGTKENFEKLVKMKLVVLYGEILFNNIFNNFNTDDFNFVSIVETMQTFEEKINSDEFNKDVTRDEATEYINKYAEFIKADLNEKYNYSDSYINNIIDVVIDNIFKQQSGLTTGRMGFTNPFGQNQDSEKYNLQSILKQFKSNVENIIKEPNLAFYTPTGNLFDGNITPFSTQMLEAFSKSSNMQLQLLSKLFTSVIQEKGFNDEEANAFINRVFKDCGANTNNSVGILSLTMEDLTKLDKNGDGSWFNELSNKINNLSKLYSHMEQDTIDNVKTIDAEQFIRNFATHGMTDYTMVDKIVMQFDSMTLSSDPAMRKLAQMLNKAFEKYNCQSQDEKKDLVRMLLMLAGQKSGDTVNTKKFYLAKDNIEQLNQNDIFAQLQEIIDDYSNWSMVCNDYYQGHTYYVQKEGDIYTITDTDTAEVTVVDLNKMVEHLPEDKKSQALEFLRKVPAEVLIDMWYESTFVDGSLEGTAGTYWSNNDSIRLNEYDETMIHETGHALANTKYGDFSRSAEFVSCFESELSAYIAEGNIQGKWEYIDGVYTHTNHNSDGFYTGENYCTKNADEFFAECYTFLMVGSGYRATDIITEYFPQSLNMVKEYLEQVRNIAPSNRRN